VVWRPIHEFTGPFWWGGSPDHHHRVWKQMFNYFKGKGLNNLLWVVSSYPTGQHKDYLAGPQYVDTSDSIGLLIGARSTASALIFFRSGDASHVITLAR